MGAVAHSERDYAVLFSLFVSISAYQVGASMAKQIYGSDVFDFAKIKEAIGVDAFHK